MITFIFSLCLLVNYIFEFQIVLHPFLYLKKLKQNLVTPTKFDSRKHLNSFVVFLPPLFALYSFQKTDLSNPLLRSFDSVLLFLVDTVTTGTYNFGPLVVKIIKLLLALPLTLSTPTADKTQYLGHLSFNSTLRLINAISSVHQKRLKYFNGTAIVAFFRIPLASFAAGWAAALPNNSALYFKDLKI